MIAAALAGLLVGAAVGFYAGAKTIGGAIEWKLTRLGETRALDRLKNEDVTLRNRNP